MFLRELVGELFIEFRTSLFEMEVGRLAYDILNEEPDFKLSDKVKNKNRMQLLVILRCIISNLDYEMLLEKDYNYKQMEELRQYLLRGMDISLVKDDKIDHQTMKLIRDAKTRGEQIPTIDYSDFHFEQIEQIFKACSQGLDISSLLNAKLDPEVMESMRHSLLETKRQNDMKDLSKHYQDIHERIFGK